ncbi:MAG: desulfoferrodoxin family protein, partial [Oscillospiraceae bacterium]
MSKNNKFFICDHCKNLVGMINNAGVPLFCCGQKMTELIPNTTDAAGEKHLPQIKIDGNAVTVNVGSISHPMEDGHFIGWIYLETTKGGQRKSLKAGEEPVVTFFLSDEKPISAFSF